MAQTWNVVIRQILLRGNFFAGDQAALAAAYNTALFTDALITDSGAEYPFKAVADGILEAMAMIIGAIGANRESPYRPWFTDDTANIANRGAIPLIGATGAKARYGVISDVRDATDNKPCSFQPRSIVEIAGTARPRFKVNVYEYFADDTTMWHTRTNVKGRIVVWDRAAELTSIIGSNDVATCPLPDDLLPVLEKGALAFIFKDTFNTDQAQINWSQFIPELDKIAGRPMAALEMNPKV
jgi:hypothetical protein